MCVCVVLCIDIKISNGAVGSNGSVEPEIAGIIIFVGA